MPRLNESYSPSSDSCTMRLPGWIARWAIENDPSGRARPQPFLREILGRSIAELESSKAKTVRPRSIEQGAAEQRRVRAAYPPEVGQETDGCPDGFYEEPEDEQGEQDATSRGRRFLKNYRSPTYPTRKPEFPWRIHRTARSRRNGRDCWGISASDKEVLDSLAPRYSVRLILCEADRTERYVVYYDSVKNDPRIVENLHQPEEWWLVRAGWAVENSIRGVWSCS